MPDADTLVDGFALGELQPARRFIVVSTQGKGDEAALRAAVATDAAYHAFVGSRRKMAALREKLVAAGVAARGARPRQGAGRARSRRHHAGRNRDVDPGRDHRRAPPRPARRHVKLRPLKGVEIRSMQMNDSQRIPAVEGKGLGGAQRSRQS